jgi:hypothetical protein
MLPQRLPRCGYAVDISYGEISVPQQDMWENQRKQQEISLVLSLTPKSK